MPYKSCCSDYQAKTEQCNLQVSNNTDILTSYDVIEVPSNSINGWITIVQGTDFPFDWDRTYAEYQRGFGLLGCNFWIGLDILYLLTGHGKYRMRIEMAEMTSPLSWYSMEFTSFSVGGESTYYRMTWSGLASDERIVKVSNASEFVSFHNGRTFLTKDMVNNTVGYNNQCTKLFKAGWWFGDPYVPYGYPCVRFCPYCQTKRTCQSPDGSNGTYPFNNNVCFGPFRVMIKKYF